MYVRLNVFRYLFSSYTVYLQANIIPYLGSVEFGHTSSQSESRGLKQRPDLCFIFTEEQPKSVVKVKLQVAEYRSALFIQDLNWQEFDEQASNLPNLEIAELHFYLPQNLAVVRALAEIIPHLSLLRNTNKLRATYQGRSPLYHDLNLDDLEGSLSTLGGISK